MEPASLQYPAKAILALIASLLPLVAQSHDPTEIGQQPLVQRQATPNATQTAPQTLTLKDALDLAQKNDPAFLSALTDAAIAGEDRAQARAAVLPTFGAKSDYLGTQGNGKLASGRFVTNDGVHVYRDWVTMH